MRLDVINGLAEQMVARHEKRETSPEQRAPLEIDLEHYRSQKQFEAERRFFHETPLMMGFSVDLPEVGSIKTNDFLDTPVLLVRTAANTVKAFANMCRHRGARLVDSADCRKKHRNLTCPYHGWVYGMDGTLKSVEKEYLFGQFDKSTRGLIELPCEERHGMIFVRLAPGEHISVDAHLGADLAAELSTWDFSRLHFVDSTVIDTPSNWKVQADTFFENYHVESLHKNTIGGLALSGWEMVESYGRHQRMLFAQRSIREFPAQPPTEQNGHKYLSFVYHIFPNIFIVYGYLWVQYFEIYPGRTIAEQKTRFSLYGRRPMLTEEHREKGKQYFQLNMDFVPTEDYLMGQQVTRSILSGAEASHLFGHAEKALVHFHKGVREAVGLDPDGLFAAPIAEKPP
ncbi:MAG: aromatic ring-hydroxylating dioxygenase subunit alpha [Porticoccaceae bacterium]